MANPTVNEWADMMPQTVTIEPWASYKGGGSGANYDDPVTYQCRIEMGNHLVVNESNQTVTSRGKVFLLASTIIGMKDRVTLPVGFLPRQPPILTTDVNDDETGNHHCCLHLG